MITSIEGSNASLILNLAKFLGVGIDILASSVLKYSTYYCFSGIGSFW
jgi:hypothetical protein